MATEAQQRARATWAAGDFDAIAERIWGVGEDLGSRVGVNEGDRVLGAQPPCELVVQAHRPTNRAARDKGGWFRRTSARH